MSDLAAGLPGLSGTVIGAIFFVSIIKPWVLWQCDRRRNGVELDGTIRQACGVYI
jgi:hypothetical protein